MMASYLSFIFFCSTIFLLSAMASTEGEETITASPLDSCSPPRDSNHPAHDVGGGDVSVAAADAEES